MVSRLMKQRKGDTSPVLWIVIVIVIGLVVAAIMIYLTQTKTSDLNKGIGCPDTECTAKQPCAPGYAPSFTPCSVKSEDGKTEAGRCCKPVPE